MTKIIIHPAPDTSTPALLFAEWKNLSALNKKNIHAALADKEKALLEEQKRYLMHQFHTQLKDNCHPADLSPAPLQDFTTESSSFKKYFMFLFSGLAVNMVHGFVSSIALLSLITAISNPVLLIASGVMSMLNACTYNFFEGYLLKQNLGIPILTKSVQKTLAVYEDQITIMEKINRALFNVVAVSHYKKLNQYEEFSAIAVAMNKSVQGNKRLFAVYKEKKITKAIRLSFMIFGSTMAAGTGFFAAKALLGIVAVSLLGTPVGWGLVIGAAVFSVVFHLGLKPKKMFNMLNPVAQKFKKIQDKFAAFKPKKKNDFSMVLRHRSSLVNPVTLTTSVTIAQTAVPKHQQLRLFHAPKPIATQAAASSLPRSKSLPLITFR
jgi:hypothetical protein